MQAISFHELIATTDGTPFCLGEQLPLIQRIETDSRRIQPGDLFWALIGQRHDGHHFVKQALAAGAVAVVIASGSPCAENTPRIEVDDTLAAFWKLSFWYRNQFDSMVIGVTGSVGKTTTRRMIAATLSANFQGIQSPENYNNQFGVPMSLLRIEPAHEFAVIELGASQPGEIDALARLAQPEIGVITTIGPAHLDGFGSMEVIARTKAELIDVIPESGFLVLNGDDKLLVRASQNAHCPVMLVGEKEHNTLRASQIHHVNGCLSFRVQDAEFSLNAVGRHHLTSALVSIAIGRQIGMSDAEIQRGLQQYTAVPGRSYQFQLGQWTVIDDTYNASPLSMSAACQVLKDWQTTGRRILVTGDMLSLGDWTQDFHRMFGEEVARSGIDYFIAVGSQAVVVAGSARKNGMDAGCLGVCRNDDLVLMLLDCWLSAGDVILVKGSREMHMERIIRGLEQLAAQDQKPEAPLQRAA